MFLLIFSLILLVILKIILLTADFPFDLRELIKPTSHYLHVQCVDQTLHFTQFQEAAAALVCGHQIESIELQNTFAATGLIHLMVVSGSHLLVLERFFHIFKPLQNPAVKFSILFAFVLMCEINGPIARSFVALALAEIIRSKKWAWSACIKQWITSFLCFFINPLWIFSLGFQMSWLASLAMDISNDFFKENSLKQNTLRTGLIFTSFIFVFSYLGFPSFWSPLISLILTPVLEFLLFPLALLGTMIDPLHFLFENLFVLLNLVLRLFKPEKNFLWYLDRESVLHLNSFMILILLTACLKTKKVKT